MNIRTKGARLAAALPLLAIPLFGSTGSAAAAMIAVQKGAAIVRVHDVTATRDALAVWEAVAKGGAPPKKAQKPFGSQRFEDD